MRYISGAFLVIGRLKWTILKLFNVDGLPNKLNKLKPFVNPLWKSPLDEKVRSLIRKKI